MLMSYLSRFSTDVVDKSPRLPDCNFVAFKYNRIDLKSSNSDPAESKCWAAAGCADGIEQ
jgi:hypothetical protein